MWAPRRVTISVRVKPLALNVSKASDTDSCGPGRLASLVETRPSRRPVGTAYLGPPARTTASRVATVITSAQETVLGQAASTAFLASSMRS